MPRSVLCHSAYHTASFYIPPLPVVVEGESQLRGRVDRTTASQVTCVRLDVVTAFSTRRGLDSRL